MKLQLEGLRGREDMRNITDSVLRADLGSRINFDLEAQVVRIESRLTLDDAMAAITRIGYRVASVVDATTVDAAFRAERGAAWV